MKVSAIVTGDKVVTAELRAIVDRTSGPERARLMSVIGKRVALDHVPVTIRENRPGWPSPSSRSRAWRQGGQPLIDTARLVNSWAWKASPNDVRIYTAVRYARQLNLGGVIRPKGMFLNIPLSPPLKMTEARGFPRGKSAIAARYPGSFGLFHGPEGPGIYRKSRVRTGSSLKTRKARYASRSLGIERIAAWVRQVRQKAHHFDRWRAEWMADLVGLASRFLVTGKIPAAAVVGGTADRGPRGGQLR